MRKVFVMPFKLKNDLSRVQKRPDKKVLIHLPKAKPYSQCTKEGNTKYPVFEGLKNPKKTSE